MRKGQRFSRFLLAVLVILLTLSPAAEAFPAAEEASGSDFSSDGAAGTYKKGGNMLALPGALTEVEEEAFYGVAAEHILVSGNVTEIQDRAFDGVADLTSVYLPEEIQRIGNNAFGRNTGVLFLGEEGSFAESWAREHRFVFSRTKVRKSFWKQAVYLYRTSQDESGEAEFACNQTGTAQFSLKAEASGAVEIRAMGRGERAEMNHLIGLFP